MELPMPCLPSERDGKVHERSKRVTLCIRRPRKSLQQGSERRVVLLLRKPEMAETYVQLVQDMYKASEIG